MHLLAAIYRDTDQRDRALPLFEETLNLRKSSLGADHPETLCSIADLGWAYKDAGRFQEAIPLLEHAHRALAKYPSLRWVGPHLLECYAKTGNSKLVTSLSKELVAEGRNSLAKESSELAGHLASIGWVLLESKADAESEPLLRESLTILEKKEPDNWRTYSTKSTLGGALLGQKKYAEAESHLLKGYEGMKPREKSVSPLELKLFTPEALDRLIQLYTETNKPEEVKKWQAEKDKLPKPTEKK